MYIKVKNKLEITLLFSVAWVVLAYYLALPWVNDLNQLFSPWLTWTIVIGLALVPGIGMSFIVVALILDQRPVYRQDINLPGISILIAAYNEEKFIRQTLDSICQQEYPSNVQIIVIDDGSLDQTYQIANNYSAEDKEGFDIKVVRLMYNVGKAGALNHGLKHCEHEIIITIDADTFLHDKALENLVTNLVAGPGNTAAVAGTVLVHNSRKNLVTKMQEWDYFHGISVIKRIQSLFQGTLVAQGAFSAYYKQAIIKAGGWPDTVGEDIVLTWALLEQGYRIGYAENAFVFTNVPETYAKFFRQRKRWSRGLMEAFGRHPRLLVNFKLNSFFVWLNLMFPYIDFIYLFVFLPGLIAAIFFQFYAIVGLMTVLLLPMALLINALIYRKQSKIFKQNNLHVRKNLLGFIVYTMGYQAIMSPACVFGYLSEFLAIRRSW